MYLVFDTETTDLPRGHLDLGHPLQLHLLQFAGIVFDDDGQEIDKLSTLVRPSPGALLHYLQTHIRSGGRKQEGLKRMPTFVAS